MTEAAALLGPRVAVGVAASGATGAVRRDPPPKQHSGIFGCYSWYLDGNKCTKQKFTFLLYCLIGVLGIVFFIVYLTDESEMFNTGFILACSLAIFMSTLAVSGFRDVIRLQQTINKLVENTKELANQRDKIRGEVQKLKSVCWNVVYCTLNIEPPLSECTQCLVFQNRDTISFIIYFHLLFRLTINWRKLNVNWNLHRVHYVQISVNSRNGTVRLRMSWKRTKEKQRRSIMISKRPFNSTTICWYKMNWPLQIRHSTMFWQEENMADSIKWNFRIYCYDYHRGGKRHLMIWGKALRTLRVTITKLINRSLAHL